MKQKITASELVDVDVRFVSLVPKGANRLDFKVIKTEDGKSMKMHGFESLFTKKLSKPYVASIAVYAESNVEEAMALITKAGYTLEHKEEDKDNGLIIFHQASIEEDTPNQIIVKMKDNIGVKVVTVKAFNPTDFETSSFKELFSKAGVLPNIFMAHDVLKEVFMNILFSEEVDNSTAVKKIKKAINEFGTAITGMIENIPVSAFKIDDPSLLEEVKKELEQKEEKDMNKETPKEVAKEEVKEVDKEKVEDKKEKTEVSKSEDKNEEVEKVGAKEASEEVTNRDVIAKALEEISSDIKTLKESVSGLDELKDSVSKLENKIEEVSEVAKSADEAINGTTNANAQDDKYETKKADTNRTVPMLTDTGYGRAK